MKAEQIERHRKVWLAELKAGEIDRNHFEELNALCDLALRALATTEPQPPYCWVIEHENGEQDFVDYDPDLCTKAKTSKPLYDAPVASLPAQPAAQEAKWEPPVAVLRTMNVCGGECCPEGKCAAARMNAAALRSTAEPAEQDDWRSKARVSFERGVKQALNKAAPQPQEPSAEAVAFGLVDRLDNVVDCRLSQTEALKVATSSAERLMIVPLVRGDVK